MSLNQLMVGQPTQLVKADNIERSFEVSLRPDKKYEVVDVETGKEYAINVESVTALTAKGYEDAETLEILVFLKETLDGILKMSYADITKVIEQISDVYPAPNWVIGEIENLTIADLLAIFSSDSPTEDFKRFVS